ncbi:MAG: YHYH protein, partial [Phycisphaerales bacterium]|nr:YHYH protein [Phycisphaerales bacterium]
MSRPMSRPISRLILILIAAGTTMAHEGHVGAASSNQPERRDARQARPDGQRRMESIDLPAPEVSITIEGAFRVIRSNGLPNHPTGDFPNSGNPNALRPQTHEIRVPLEPKVASQPTPARPEFGIALNGVIFDAGTGEFWSSEGRQFGGGSAWNYEALGGGVPLGI